MDKFITVSEVSKSFIDIDGTLSPAVAKISFSVEKNEFVCIVGPSGCGKSTVLRIIAGLETATTGTVELASNAKISMIFQNFALFPWLTVAQNIAFGLHMTNKPDSFIEPTVRKLIHEMGLTEYTNSHPKELSGGMKQRVGIARALAISPDILLLDEPFSALDAFTATRLRLELLKVWHEQMSVVMVTHLVEEAVQMADRVIVMSSRPGEIVDNIPIKLARPRKMRSSAVYKLIDHITQQVQAKL